MNWVWPIAPAHEPVKFRGVVSPFCRIFSAAISCFSKKAPRRPSKASVESASITGMSPMRVPYLLSRPQTAVTTSASTP